MADFTIEAIPWFEQFQSLGDLPINLLPMLRSRTQRRAMHRIEVAGQPILDGGSTPAPR